MHEHENANLEGEGGTGGHVTNLASEPGWHNPGVGG
jgi:hypothetical protein